MTADPAKNDWENRFGAQRRAKDCALLAEAERRIAAEEKTAVRSAVNPATQHSAMSSSVDNDMRLTISRAFGRPIA